MDDIVIEETMTFIARDLGPMVPVQITGNFKTEITGYNDLFSGNLVNNSADPTIPL